MMHRPGSRASFGGRGSGRRVVSGLAALLALASPSGPALAGRRGPPPLDPAGIERLLRDAGAGAAVRLHPATGAARLLRLTAGRLPLAGASPRARSADFLRRYGRVFGIADPAAELGAAREETDRYGHTHILHKQIYRGVPVFAGQMRLHFDPSGRLTSVQGTFIPGIDVDPAPRRSAAEAASAALAHVRSRLAAGDLPSAPGGGGPARLVAAPIRALETRLMIYRTGLARRVEGRSHLAWEVEVGNGTNVREFVYVDARTGKVIDRITGLRSLLDRRIHQPAFNNVVIWSEGDPLPYSTGDPVNDGQVNGLIDFSEDVYGLFANLSDGSFLSWDGDSATMHSVWKDPTILCPNASWNGTTTNYCDGVAGDDTVAHEWTHAYTDGTSALIYRWQPGALNESYSDIFGETVDLLNEAGTDSPVGPRSADGCSTFARKPPPAIVIEAPAGIAGAYGAGGADFNPDGALSVSAEVQEVGDGVGALADACQRPIGFVPGRIALIDRGNCTFVTKVLNAQIAGASGAIIVNTAGDNVFTMGGTSSSISIPAALIGRGDGDLVKAALGAGVVATLSLRPRTDLSLRWLHGEDDFAFGLPIRDMWNPNCYADPGKLSDSIYYVCDTNDQGGVHSNSGVPNHAFALLVDGGTYNARAIAPLGIAKAAHIHWRAMRFYLLRDSDFADHADALEQACADLIGMSLTDPLTGGPSDQTIGPEDCAAVAEAMLAVEMREPPVECGFQPLLDPNPPPLDCGAPVFFDDLEAGPAGTWSLSNFGVNPEYVPRDWEWTASVPPGGSGSAFFALDDIDLGDCVPGSDDQSGVMRLESPPIRLPDVTADPVLSFDHYVATEAGWDGGNLEISVNGGAFQPIRPADFLFNPYNSTLETAADGNTNPLAGQPAFTGSDGGELRGSWGQSRVALGLYAGPGDTVRLRFAFGVDGCNGLDGWYVDNPRVCLDCSGAAGADGDLDGHRVCDGDCDDADAATYPGAPEANDGADNQCPGEPGHGLTDEISGATGFADPGDDSLLSWTPQAGATSYQVARSATPDFSAGCTAFVTLEPSLADAATPAVAGDVLYYLVRPLAPFPGTWGTDSSEVERSVACAG
ncbi:MAG: M4 family metallopeptidase [Acidobacteriota bacterium]